MALLGLLSGLFGGNTGTDTSSADELDRQRMIQEEQAAKAMEQREWLRSSLEAFAAAAQQKEPVTIQDPPQGLRGTLMDFTKAVKGQSQSAPGQPASVAPGNMPPTSAQREAVQLQGLLDRIPGTFGGTPTTPQAEEQPNLWSGIRNALEGFAIGTGSPGGQAIIAARQQQADQQYKQALAERYRAEAAMAPRDQQLKVVDKILQMGDIDPSIFQRPNIRQYLEDAGIPVPTTGPIDTEAMKQRYADIQTAVPGAGVTFGQQGQVKSVTTPAAQEQYSAPELAPPEMRLPQGTVIQRSPSGSVRTLNDPSALQQAKMTTATTLRKEFNAQKSVENYQTLQISRNGIMEAFKLATSPDTKSKLAADQVMGVMFQKMLDPSSVVRESEYARTSEGTSLVNRLVGKWRQMQEGGLSLTDTDRMEILRMTQKLYENSAKEYNRKVRQYAATADDYGIPREWVISDLQELPEDMPDPTKANKDNVPTKANPQTMNTYQEKQFKGAEAKAKRLMNSKKITPAEYRATILMMQKDPNTIPQVLAELKSYE